MFTTRTNLAFFITFIAGLFSCSSLEDDIQQPSTSVDEASLQLSLNVANADTSTLNTIQVYTVRFFLVTEYGFIHTNQLFQSTTVTTPVQIKNVPRGTYKLYAIINEKALGLPDLAVIQTRQQLDDLSAHSQQFDINQGIPLVGVTAPILVEHTNQHIHIPLKRLTARMDLTIHNSSLLPLAIEEVRLGQVLHTTSNLYQPLMNKNTATLTDYQPNINTLTIHALDTQVLQAYTPELVGDPKGITLSLTTQQHGQLQPLTLARKDGSIVTHIERNNLFRIHVTIEDNQLLHVGFEVVDWKQEEIDIPVFS